MTTTRTPSATTRTTACWIAPATLAWATLYGLLRLYWTLTGTRPQVPPVGDDLLVFSDWGIITLSAATAALTLALTRHTPPAPDRPLLAAAWTVAALTTAAALLLLLDVVGLLLLNTSGVPLHGVPVVFAENPTLSLPAWLAGR